MLDFRDLMLGNLVYCPDLGRVIEVNSTTFNGRIVEFEGIPVTKELLEKIGFEKGTTAGEPWEFWRYWDKDGRYKLDVYPEELYCNSNRKFGLHVDNGSCETIGSGEFTYVHELMNLVRAITGHSLPIEKEVFDGVGNES